MVKEETIIVEILYEAVQFAGVSGNAVKEVVIPNRVELKSDTYQIDFWMIVAYP